MPGTHPRYNHAPAIDYRFRYKIKPNDFVRMYISNQGLKKYIGQTFGSRSEYLCQTEKDGDK
mgnify:CR=1 FL=1